MKIIKLKEKLIRIVYKSRKLTTIDFFYTKILYMLNMDTL